MTSDVYDSPRPGSIWAQIYRNKTYEEIKVLNRFANRKSINDTSDLSDVRRQAINELFKSSNEISLVEIKERGNNFGVYAAFRAIAHGFARWDEDRLMLVKLSY